MSSAQLEDLLAPISPEHAGGADPDCSPDMYAIRRLRQGDDLQLPQGHWVREVQTPQWPRVRELCERILAGQGKDLRVAGWHLEALAHVEGFRGLAFGLEVLGGLLERYWDEVPPALFPEDREERIARLEWLNDDRQLPVLIASIPMTRPETGGLSYLSWQESRLVENLGLRDPQARDQAAAEGKPTGDAWQRAVRDSGRGFCLQLADDIRQARTAFQALEERVDRCCGQDAPVLGAFREALRGCAELADQMVGGFSPDLPAETQDCPPAGPAQDPSPTAVPSGVGSREEALQRLQEVATYFRNCEPHSPVGPLVERAARWAEMPLGQWLARVIKDEGTLGQLRELLDLASGPGGAHP